MRIEFTVIGPAGPRDVAVSAAAATLWRDVLPALARLAGAGPEHQAWLGSRAVSGALGDGSPTTGAVVSFGAAPPPVRPSGLQVVHVIAGGGVVGGADDPVPLRREGVTIGRDPGCDLVLADDRASRRHAMLRPGPAGVTAHELGSTNGTTVDGVPVAAEGSVVGPAALVRVGDSLLAVRAPDATPRAALMRGTDGGLQVNRAPRSDSIAAAPVIENPVSATVVPPGRVQWFAALVPAVAGGLLAWLLNSPMFLLFALLSPVLLLGTALGDRLHWRRERRRRDTTTRSRRAELSEQIDAALRAETERRRSQLPDPTTLLDIATRPGRRLWERGPGDADHLVVRVGSADADSETSVRDATGSAPAGVVPTVPVPVDLRTGPLGVAGPAGVVDDVARWVLAQLAVLQAPSEVEIVPVLAHDGWGWCRWLPHLRAAPLPDPDAAAATLASLTALLDRRREAGRSTRGAWSGRWTVVIADRLVGTDAAALADLLSDGTDFGITAICLADSPAALPSSCRTVAVADTASPSRLTLRRPAGELAIIAERVGQSRAERIARALAPFTDARAGATLPTDSRWGDLVALPDLDAATNLQAASDGGARAVLGQCRDGPVTIDLVADGPHALIAGTTGSGKSELLRTLVVGLAAGYSPEELSFLLVDYKGGAAFADAVRLPHTTGVLTDLDSALTGRALHSLDAELRRRERLFAAAGADDLTGYRAWRRAHRDATPLARLVIVVDEFAELAGDLPEFVSGLVGVARRGRSLGVHLVLATQRPGSVVSAEIRANTALRIALRVTEPVESADVIGVPDAALIDPAVPGRALAHIGGRLVELQTARVAAELAASRPVVEPLGPWRRPGVHDGTARRDDELGRVVGLLADAARHTGSAVPHAAWLPPLPAHLPLSDVSEPDEPTTPWGRLDRPDEQSQPVFGLDPSGDTVLVVGQARSGRTTSLVTAALAATGRTSPGALQVHVIDGGGELADTLGALPHLATVATRAEPDLVVRLLDRLASRDHGGDGSPRALLLVDDWDLITSGQDDAVAAQWTERLAAVVRTAGPDLSAVVAGGRSLLSPRFSAGFASRLVLPLAEPTDYGMAGVPPAAVPAAPTPGGGVRVPDGVAFRIAHAGAEPTLAAARAAAGEIARRWAGQPGPHPGLRLRALPTGVALDTVRTAARATGTPGLVLGLAGDTAAPCVVDVVGLRARLLVAGPARSGRSTTLMTAASEAARLGHAVDVVAPHRSPLREHARLLGARLLDARLLDAPPHPPPRVPTLLLVDDVEVCDPQLADTLAGWLADPSVPLGAMVAGRGDELVTSYGALVTAIRRERCGIVLRPGLLDGELLGVRARPAAGTSPPGRGLVVGDPRWGTVFTESDAVPIQVARP